MRKYAIRITESTLELIKVLSGGQSLVEEMKTPYHQGQFYYLFTCDLPTTTTDHEIIDEDDLYVRITDDAITILM